MKNRGRQNSFVRTVKKLLLSAFVVVTFTGYALENRATAGAAAPAPSAATGPAGGTPPGGPASAPPGAPAATAAPQAAPTATSAPALTTRSAYKDGTYTGPAIWVSWGNVQVQATIQNGKVSNVQFLQYPNDRRTSERISYFAVPALQQEAIQAQSANVDIITGATLTSEGFERSLQAALSRAKS